MATVESTVPPVSSLPFSSKISVYEHRQVAVFLGSQHSRLGLVAVAHGFDEHEVCARRRTDANGFSEQLDRPFKRQVAHRLEQLAGRADVERNIGILSACLLDARFLHAKLQLVRFPAGYPDI